ncbi:bifunctional metallophosphatase/5'-nucleotidase [Bacillus marasmi]|uniref:bifunctional metallophosphatase/5'-nucleotidase n=1 Tax=Bacillus marasmi TaxID=1926279 RepID=UPI0011CA79F0|nr:bifunctional UDP-sugar hydrolase/5'-nucleotidase [Bacillus marasmi]
MEVIHIYHTNDLHSHFDHWPRIHSLLQERKKWHTEAGDNVLLLDIGDHVDRFHPYSDGTLGKGNVDLLNKAEYTAITIGNNEGITFPFEALDDMYTEAQFPVLAANLYYEDGRRPQWAKPHTIVTTNKGTRVGLIGITVFYEHLYQLLGWKLTDPIIELRKQVDELKNQTDILVLLSHMGINDDEAIARDFPEIDVILGAHTHHVFHEGKEINNSLVCAAGKYGQFVGHVILELENHTIQKQKALLYDTNDLPAVDAEEKLVAEYFDEGKLLLQENVVELQTEIKADNFKESPLPSLLCDALREWCEADCAFLNAGLLLDGLKQGPITRFDLLDICPHPINPATVLLQGKELKEVLLHTRDEQWPHLQVRGLGFRGVIMGTFIYSRITFKRDQQSVEIFINGEEINSTKQYKVAIPDMFTFGRFFPEIFRSKTKEYFLPEFLRDLLEWKLKSY